MSKKFSIVKNLDESKLQEELRIYENENIGDPYIFLNKETLNELAKSHQLYPYNHKGKFDVIAMYTGYKIYLNDSLNYGEVELR